jgi:hypothetical protein
MSCAEEIQAEATKITVSVSSLYQTHIKVICAEKSSKHLLKYIGDDNTDAN